MSKTLDDIDTVPPDGAQEAARKALRWRDEHPDEIDGGTRTGWERANQLDNGEELSEETVQRMNSFFSRHMAQGNHELDDEYEGEPWKDAGYVAHLLWGGDTGASWAEDKVEEFENVRESTENAAVELAPDDDLTDEERRLQSLMDEEEAGLANDLRSIAIDHRRDFKERVRDGATSPEHAEEIRQELRDEYLPRYREAIRTRMARIRQQAQGVTIDHNDWASVVREAELPGSGEVELEQFEDSMTVVISDLAREILQRNQGLMSDELTERLRQTPPDGEPTRRQIERLSDDSIEGIASKAGSTAVSEGRDDVAQAATDDDGRMQEGDGNDETDVERGRRVMAVRNAVLDANTCDPCRDLDGEAVEFGSARYARLTPPAECEGRHRCRCYWEYTTKSPQEIQNASEYITMAISVGDFVEWDWSGGTAQGKVEDIERDGTLEVGDTTREGTEDRAAVKIQHYEPDGDGYSPVNQRVVKYEDNLREIDPLDKPDGTARNSAVEMSDSDGYVQLFPWGKVEHQDHPDGGFTVDAEFAEDMAGSFHFLANNHGWHPPILQQHRHDGHVWGRVTELKVRHGDGIYGRIEWAPAAEQKLEAGLIDSLSPTFTPEWEDPETGRQLSHVLHEVSYVSVEHLRSNETVQETLAAAADDDLFVALADDDLADDSDDPLDTIEFSHPEHEDHMQLFCHFLQHMVEKASTPEGLPGPDPETHYEDLAEGADISGDELQEMVEADRYRLPTDAVLANVVDKFGVEEQALRTGEAFQKMEGESEGEPDEPDEPEPPEEALDEREREERRPEEMGDDDMEMGYGDEMENAADPEELQSLRRENARLQLQTHAIDLDDNERERALKLAEQDPDAFELALDIGGSAEVESSTPHDGRPDIEQGSPGTAPVGNDLESTVRRAKRDGIEQGRELLEHIQSEGFTDPDHMERLEALTDDIY